MVRIALFNAAIALLSILAPVVLAQNSTAPACVDSCISTAANVVNCSEYVSPPETAPADAD